MVVLGGVSLYLLLPNLLAVSGSWRSLSGLDWPFAGLALVAEIASFVWLPLPAGGVAYLLFRRRYVRVRS